MMNDDARAGPLEAGPADRGRGLSVCSPERMLCPAARRKAADDELADVSRKLNNPVGPLWLLFTQNDYTVYGGRIV